MAEIGNRSDIDIDVGLLRHMVVNSIRSYKLKFERDYGELVIACDSKKYWRKQYFPYYKANRKKAREESGLNWPLIFDTINVIKQELIQFFPYKVLEVEGAEADDIIASLAWWSSNNDLKENSLISESNPFLIISGDHDFVQLQKYKHIKQFSPVQKKFVAAEIDPKMYVIEHTIKGDKGDGVPNVLSSDDVFIKGGRQKPISSKKLAEWVSDPDTMPKDTTFTRNFDRNKTLVDFTYIPSEIRDQIINTFLTIKCSDRSQLLNFFIKHKMKQMLEHIGEF